VAGGWLPRYAVSPLRIDENINNQQVLGVAARHGVVSLVLFVTLQRNWLAP
jgi:hypothetical protein